MYNVYIYIYIYIIIFTAICLRLTNAGLLEVTLLDLCKSKAGARSDAHLFDHCETS